MSSKKDENECPKDNSQEGSKSTGSYSKTAHTGQKKLKLLSLLKIPNFISCSCSQTPCGYSNSLQSLPITLGKIYRRDGDIPRSASTLDYKISTTSNSETVLDQSRQIETSAEQLDSLIPITIPITHRNIENVEIINLKSLKLSIKQAEEYEQAKRKTTENNLISHESHEPEIDTACEQSIDTRLKFKEPNLEDLHLLQSKWSDSDLHVIDSAYTPATLEENQQNATLNERTVEHRTLLYLLDTTSINKELFKINPTTDVLCSTSEKKSSEIDVAHNKQVVESELHQLEKIISKETLGINLIEKERSEIKIIETTQLNENSSGNSLDKYKSLKVLPTSISVTKTDTAPTLSATNSELTQTVSVLDFETRSEDLNSIDCNTNLNQEMLSNIALCVLFTFLWFICMLVP